VRARWHSNLQPTLDRFERFARAMATNLHLLQTCAERCHEHGAGTPWTMNADGRRRCIPLTVINRRPCFDRATTDLLGDVGRLATTMNHLLASDESSSLVGRITDQLARITVRDAIMV